MAHENLIRGCIEHVERLIRKEYIPGVIEFYDKEWGEAMLKFDVTLEAIQNEKLDKNAIYEAANEYHATVMNLLERYRREY